MNVSEYLIELITCMFFLLCNSDSFQKPFSRGKFYWKLLIFSGFCIPMVLILQAVGSSYETSAPSAWNATWPHQVYGNETTTMLPNQTKFTHALRCEVCKLDVNSRDSYEKHIAGKKHKKNLRSGISSFQVQALIGPVVKQPETKNQVVQSKVCTTCNVLCTSHDTYIKHIAGKKHAAQVNC